MIKITNKVSYSKYITSLIDQTIYLVASSIRLGSLDILQKSRNEQNFISENDI